MKQNNIPTTTLDTTVRPLVKSLAERYNETNSTIPLYAPSHDLKDVYYGDRYKQGTFVGSDYEEMYAQQQGQISKMVNGVSKGLILTGTTFLQSTVGMVNGVIQASKDGRFASFYDNEFNNKLDEINKWSESNLPNFYTKEEKDARWYSPSKLISANFIWDGIVKNLGFAAGAALSGGVFSAGIKSLSSIPQIAKLVSSGKLGQAIAVSEESLVSGGNVASTIGKIKDISDKAIVQYNTYNNLNKAQRVLVAGLATTGEAGFEALHNLNDFREAKIQEYINTYGKEPIGEDLEKIDTLSDKVGNSSFALNTILLSATNYIQFPKILGSSYKSEKAMLNGLTNKIDDITKEAGQYTVKTASTKTGRVLSSLNKIRPYLFSVSEGFEEGAQFAISKGTEDYYNKKYENKDTDFMESLIAGVKETVTTNEGMENILIGGLSGSIMLARGKYKEAKTLKENTETAISDFNKFKISDFTKDTFDSVNRGIVLQQNREELLKEGNIAESKDIEEDYIINYLTPRIKYGRFDLVKSDIEDLKSLASTNEGFKQLQEEGKALPTDTEQAYLQRLLTFEKTAENVKSLYQSLNLRYGGIITDDGKKVYTSAVIDKMVYAASKIANYDFRIPALSTSLNFAGIPINDIVQDLTEDKIDSFNKAINEIGQLKEINGKTLTQDDKDELKTALEDVAFMAIKRDDFVKEYNELKSTPENFKETPPKTVNEEGEEVDENGNIIPKETITVKTKKGEKEIELGTEYFLGRVVEKDDKGHEIYRAPKITILGENEDGTIKIKASNGNIKDISKDELEDYNLGKVSATLKNKKAKFYMEHWNTIFEFNFGEKKGGKKKGRIEYDSEKGIMYFVYKNKKGEVKKIEVTGDQFKAKKGFKEPMIKNVGELTPVQQQSLDAFTSEKDARLDAKLENRINILNTLLESNIKKITSINIKLENNKNRLKNIDDEIENIYKTKQGQPRKRLTKTLLKLVQETSKLKETLPLEINELEDQLFELQQEQEVINSILQDDSTYSLSGNEFLDNIKEEIDKLEELIDFTKEAKEKTEKQLSLIDELYIKALNLLNDFIKRIQEENPNVPLSLETFRENIEKYLGEKGTELFIENRQGFTNDVLEIENALLEYEGELKIPEYNKKAEELSENIKELEKGLNDLISTQIAYVSVLNAFKDEIIREKKIKQEERDLQAKEEILQAFLGINETYTQNIPLTTEEDKIFEPTSKKAKEKVTKSTTFPTGENLKEHHKRADRFGFRFNSLPNKDSIRGVVVTANTEKDIIPGLTKHLLPEDTTIKDKNGKLVQYKASEMVVLVMTDEFGKPIDENGIVIPEDGDLLNTAIYQTFPIASLENSRGSLFRESVSNDEVIYYKNEYEKWLKNELEQTNLGQPSSIEVSFGIPEYIGETNEKGVFTPDYDARSSIEEAKLLPEGHLSENAVLEIPTTNTSITNGSVTFDTIPDRAFLKVTGRVFLKVTGGLHKLLNKKFNKTEAETIYKVILQVAKNIHEDKAVKTERTLYLFKWLKSVIYWGTPKDKAGYNSVWFDKVVDADGKSSWRLFFSGKGGNFNFTPSSIESSKGAIMTLLQEMYGNTNATMIKDTNYNNAYDQIIDIDANGNPVIQDWQNYQTFLLSNKIINSEGEVVGNRNTDDVPLSTRIKPITGDQTNKKGFYFTLNRSIDDYVAPVKEEKKETSTPANTETPTQEASPKKEKAPEGYKLDGTEETMAFGKFGNVTFKLDGKKYNETGLGFSFDIPGDTVMALIAAGTPKEEVEQTIGQAILAKVGPQLAKLQIPEEAPIVDETPKQKEVFNSSIEKRRQNSLSNIKKIFDKDSDLYWGETIIIDNDGKEEKISDIGDVSGDKEMFWRLKETINAKYDELVKLETSEIPQEKIKRKSRPKSDKPDDAVYRMELVKAAERFEGENWEKVEEFINKNFPNIPIYRVKNIIQATNGRQAWGMLQDASIYLYEGAEVGTAYHEVFEAVWKMFAGPKEKQKIINEFRNREGSYEDRFTGELIEYSKATPEQLKEELAEEFRDAVLKNKSVEREYKYQGKTLIGKLFQDIINWFNNFFFGTDAAYNTQKLFDKIGNSYYAKYNPYESKLSYANKGIIDIEEIDARVDSEFRVKNIPAVQLHEIVEHMTFSTIAELIKNNKSLFEITKKETRKDLYKRLKDEIVNLVGWQLDQLEIAITNKEGNVEDLARDYNNKEDLYYRIQEEWENIIIKHEEKLKSYGIEFDENDELNLEDENKSGKSDWQDARKIDNFRKTNAAIKLLLGTLIYTTNNGTKREYSSIGGVKLLPVDRVFIDLINKLYDSVNLDDMFDRLAALSITNPNYAALYTRMTGKSPQTSVDFSEINENDFQLISGFWNAMKKQNADVITVFIQPDGEVIISDSVLSSQAKQAQRNITNALVSSMREGKLSKYFTYEKTKGYSAKDNIKSDKLTGTDIKTYISFLNDLGISFTKKDVETKLSGEQRSQFFNTVNGLRKSLSKVQNVFSLTAQTLDISGRLFELGVLQAIIENPEFESTYFNVNGERSQTYIGTNALSNLHHTLSKIKNIEELDGTPFSFLRTDVFSQGSVMLNKMFNLKQTGNRNSGTENLMKSIYINGMIDEEKGKNKESAKLSLRERLIQEINLNLSGIYMNLVPGDASIEWAVRMHTKESPFVTEDDFRSGRYLNIFRDYFISEVKLAQDGRNVKNNGDLRFFKSILGKDYIKVWNKKNISIDAEKLYNDKKSIIDGAVTQYIEKEAQDTEAILEEYGVMQTEAEGAIAMGISFENDGFMDRDTVNKKLGTLSVNYMIANIELHKLVYSDPYQYSDELKRIKNFLSPRQALVHGSSKINSVLNKIYNKNYKKNDIGYSDMTKDHFNSSVVDDIYSIDELYEKEVPYEDTDGGGYISSKANRIFKLRTGSWTSDNEIQQEYDIAYEKTVKGWGLTIEEKEKNGLVLSEREKSFDIKRIEKDGKAKFVGKNPGVKSTYTAIKPIVAGNKNDGNNYNDVVLHKFALVPISFRILHEMNPDSNLLKMYNKMQQQNVDYIVFNSGAKVNNSKTTPIYFINGEFNSEPFNEVNKIPFSIIGLQAEVPSKDSNYVTQGSQITKLATLDFMEAGIPIDFMRKENDFNKRFAQWNLLKTEKDKKEASPLYKEIKHNEKLLISKIEEGYNSLLIKLGIKETLVDGKPAFTINNSRLLIKTLKDEILKREVNENISTALSDFEQNKVVLEATPAYQQIRNILFSIADKNVVRPKISGGMKVQVSAAMLESVKAEGKEFKTKNGDTKYSYTSDTLKFYKNKKGERVCEIMIARWFESSLSDEELLKWLNNTSEGQKIIQGIAFRIPTQKQNSIEVFKIGKFLPKDFGDNVIVPSALVKKTGSDFDIDKLSIYFKNIFTNNNKQPEVIPYFGIGAQAIQSITLKYDLGDFNEYIKSKKDALLLDNSAEDRLMQSMFPEEYSLQRDDIINEIYKKSLENEYIASLERLISNELNFENLVKPNSAKDLNKLSDDIDVKLGNKKIDYSDVGNMLSRKFMSDLRHAFVSGKYGIGIAAVSQTNHSQNQRGVMYIALERLAKGIISKEDEDFLGDGGIKFAKYNTIQTENGPKATLSMIKDKAGNFISDTISMFIDGYVDIAKGPWIMKLGATPNVAGTWLFLIKLGVPIKDIAYFMNQPIIKDYLKLIQINGYTWLFNNRLINDIKKEYNVSKSYLKTASPEIEIPEASELWKTIGENVDNLNDSQKSKQHFMLDEFLKYSKMANHLLQITQASNYDTANINDSLLLFKKEEQLKNARKTIISSVDDLMQNSFIDFLRKKMENIRNSFAELLISDKSKVRPIMEEVLRPYVSLPDRDFVKVAQKAVNDLFDWSVQTNSKINTKLTRILLGKDNEQSAARQIIEFKESIIGNSSKGISAKPNHPLYNNIILKNISLENNKGVRVDNLFIAGRDNKIYDQNLIIYSFRELREALKNENKDLYGKFVRLAVVQSGLTNSPIAFTSLLPYEDFKEIYNNTLSNLEKMPNLVDFYNLHVFERNNWNNSDIIPYMKARMVSGMTGNIFNTNETNVPESLKKAMNENKIPKVVSIGRNSQEGRFEFVTYVWESKTILNPVTGKYEATNKKTKEAARKRGDYSYINKVLLQKVYTEDDNGNRIPLITKKDKYENIIYKAINAWGDSFRAQEFYDHERSSVLQNDYMKIFKQTDETGKKITSGEVTDDEIIKAYMEENISEENNSDNIVKMQPDNVAKIKAGTKTITNRTENAKLTEGINSLPDGTKVNVKLLGEATNLDGVISFDGRIENTLKDVFDTDNIDYSPKFKQTYIDGDSFAKAEGFKDWNDFKKNAKFSDNFIKGNQKRFIYSVIPLEINNNAPEGLPSINRTNEKC